MIAAIVVIIVVVIASTVAAWQLTRPPATTETYYFGLAIHDQTNAWEALMADGFLWYCQDHGIKAVMLDARHTIDLQAQQIHSLVDMGVDALLVCPVDQRALNPSLDYAKEHNVPVMTTPYLADSPVPLMWVAASFYEQGQIAANYTVNFLKQKYGEAKGVAFELRGLTGETAAEQRHNGFIDVLKDYPDIEVLTQDTQWMTEVATTQTEQVMQTRSDIDTVYCANLAIVDGFVAGMKALNKDPEPYYVIGLDAGPNVLKDIRDNIVDICIEQGSPAFYSGIICQYLLGYLQHGESALPKYGGVVTLADMTITGTSHYGVDIWAYPTWPPATITNTHDEVGTENNQRHFKQSNAIITKDNVDDPAWWGNMKLPGW